MMALGGGLALSGEWATLALWRRAAAPALRGAKAAAR